jgi:hypothetical protein
VLPSDEYEERRRIREARVAEFEKAHIRLGNIRLLLAVATAILLWMSLRQHRLSALWVVCPIAAFVAIAVWH